MLKGMCVFLANNGYIIYIDKNFMDDDRRKNCYNNAVYVYR